MHTLLPILAGLLKTDVKSAVHRARRNMLLYAAALLALVTAYVGAVVALGIHAAAYFGPAVAAWLIAGLALATALAFVAAVLLMNRIDRREKAKREAAQNQKVLATAALASVPTLVRARPIPLLIVAALGGIALAQAMRSQNTD
ncbi:MAG: hypothetical protein R3D43_13225 [Tepidamorphaceae bacterium]|nr:hypothetical protein [Rhodobiaceae bacterium]MCC0049321.1 hypothetical protein [Rhodobiaceae bacterium]